MFTLSTMIRMYIMLSIVVMISFFVILTSVDVILEPVWGIVAVETEQIFRRLYITVITMSLIAIVNGVLVAVFVLDRGVNKYKDFLRRFDNISQHTSVRPTIIHFPDQDEFGNLGTLLNDFLKKIDYYDQMKTVLAQLEKEKFETIAHSSEHPILVVNTDTNEPYISFYNERFKDLFLKKSIFIDNNGKTQTQYFMMEETPIVNFNLKDEFDTPFLNSSQIGQLKNSNILWEKHHTLINMTFSEISGHKKYQFEKVRCVPLNNNIDNVMAQMLYIFINPTLVEKEKKSTELED